MELLRFLAGLGSVLLLACIFACGLDESTTNTNSGGSGDSGDADLQANMTEAGRVSKDYVKKFLKFPLDADFPWSPPEVRTNPEGTLFFASGTVKAPNAFGAVLTHEWATILKLEDNTWSLLACQIGDQSYKSPELEEIKQEAEQQRKRVVERALAAAEEERKREEQELRQAQADAAKKERTRKWTDATGEHSVVAEFTGMTAGKVKLTKGDGSTVTLSMDQLSEADQRWIEERR